jgi:NAD(P)-dependent dehydrogenase (short-subunit alcohol dehydrogenase family)
MVESGGGSVLNMGSTNAFFISHQPVAYHVAKAGLLHLTRYLAHEFAPHGIRVNCICPGLVDLYDDNRPLTGNPLNREVTELAVPLRRASTGADIAEAALFLCADSAACITGEVLTIDGGLGLADHFHLARKMLRSAEGRNSNCDSPGRKG